LRAPWSRSPIEAFTSGAFQLVLDDPTVADPGAVRRVVLCTGKVAFDAIRARDERGAPVAVVRVEQLYPWPEEQLTALLTDRYVNATEVGWLQEEPENMGAWSFVHGRLHSMLRDDYTVRHFARVASGSPAGGSDSLHKLEQADLIERALTL
jgi:2-oxoglutarate dehydrogenase E1 component